MGRPACIGDFRRYWLQTVEWRLVDYCRPHGSWLPSAWRGSIDNDDLRGDFPTPALPGSGVWGSPSGIAAFRPLSSTAIQLNSPARLVGHVHYTPKTGPPVGSKVPFPA